MASAVLEVPLLDPPHKGGGDFRAPLTTFSGASGRS